MTPDFPCIRHGDRSTSDPRLIDMLDRAEALGFTNADDKLAALLDYDDQLWATWRNEQARAAEADLLTRAWTLAGGGRGARHLVRSSEDYDYQEDCMNDATA
jgi:hypothetical protein